MNFLPCASTVDGASTSYNCTIRDGDLVIVYENPEAMKAVYVSAKATFQNRFGVFPHKGWIGKQFGVKVTSSDGRGWVFLLRPTPELWTQVLRHRTQILYLADISMIVSQLELRPGCIVLETGTGSGSLTHALARAVAPTGHVHTFEFHAGRADDAAKEFAQHGLTSLVTVALRNTEEQGFPAEELAAAHSGRKADAVFLDLPGPWRVVPSAAECLRPDGRFCSFSPCIEQVSRTCEALSAAGFTDIITYECLLREHVVHVERVATTLDLAPPPKRQRANDGAATGSAKPASSTVAAEAEATATAQAEGGAAAGTPGAGAAAGEDSAPADADAASTDAAAGQDAGAAPEPQVEGKDPAGADASGQGQTPAASVATPGAGPAAGAGAGERVLPPWAQRKPAVMRDLISSRPAMEARGHTGYLTFARKFVIGSPSS